MRTGISITLKPADRRRLKALARDRNTPHKHVWRAEIVLLSADGKLPRQLDFIASSSHITEFRVILSLYGWGTGSALR